MDLEIIRSIFNIIGCIVIEIRNIRNTPAVTKVEECTNAEIGVGAAIAIGSQAENGNCALFEQAANISKINVNIINSEFIVNLQLEETVIIANDNKIKISPTRFLNKVIVPEEAEEKFW